MTKFKVGSALKHKFLGTVYYTETCAYLDKFVGASDTVHVEFDGDVREVTASLVEELK